MKAKRKVYPTKLKVVIFKLKHSEYKKMKSMAKNEADGNLSKLIRYKVLYSYVRDGDKKSSLKRSLIK